VAYRPRINSILALVLLPTLGQTCDDLVAAPPLPSTFATQQRSLICNSDRTRLWATAEAAVKCADHDSLLIDQATKNLENALRREGMLD